MSTTFGKVVHIGIAVAANPFPDMKWRKKFLWVTIFGV
jgi:hypothetical protein